MKPLFSYEDIDVLQDIVDKRIQDLAEERANENDKKFKKQLNDEVKRADALYNKLCLFKEELL